MKSGRLRVLATSGAQRAEYAPEVPTVAEAGVPGYESATWFAVYGPRTLPTHLAQRWNDTVNRYLKTPQAQEQFRKQYMRIVGGTLAEFATCHKSETARWGTVIASAGIKPQ